MHNGKGNGNFSLKQKGGRVGVAVGGSVDRLSRASPSGALVLNIAEDGLSEWVRGAAAKSDWRLGWRRLGGGWRVDGSAPAAWTAQF